MRTHQRRRGGWNGACKGALLLGALAAWEGRDDESGFRLCGCSKSPTLVPPTSRAPCSDPGTIATIVAPNTWATCEACPEGYFRTGDAAANNNVCKKIPAGGRRQLRWRLSFPGAMPRVAAQHRAVGA